jgi:hypothetical protein
MASRSFKVNVKLDNGSTMWVEIQAPNQQEAKSIAERQYGKVLQING